MSSSSWLDFLLSLPTLRKGAPTTMMTSGSGFSQEDGGNQRASHRIVTITTTTATFLYTTTCQHGANKRFQIAVGFRQCSSIYKIEPQLLLCIYMASVNPGGIGQHYKQECIPYCHSFVHDLFGKINWLIISPPP
jgi:hypothetical protein